MQGEPPVTPQAAALAAAVRDITVDQYAGPYLEHPDFTWERREAAEQLLGKVNELRRRAAAAGVPVRLNPKTGSAISGSGNGGFRPIDCPVGAKNSTHKRGRGVDLYDPQRELAAWCYAARGHHTVRELGLTLENARWTPTWLHLQDVPPGPAGAAWRFDYIPSNAPPLAVALPGQVVA